MKDLKQQAKRNIKLQSWIHFLSWLVFLVPIITLFYKYTWLSLVQIVLISNVSTLAVTLLELPTSVFADITGMRKSLVISVICNAIAASFIFLFPSFWGFIVAAIFSWLYWSFRSGTGQAFLEENLEVLWKENKFWKEIGRFMALENVAGVITPLFAAFLLKRLWDSGYIILAGLDVIFAIILVVLTLQLKEVAPLKEKIQWTKKLFIKSFETAKSALKNVFTDQDLKTILLYRTFANHVAFLFVVSLPHLVEQWMQDWLGGAITALWGLGVAMFSNYAYKIGEKKGYWYARVIATIAQAVLLIIAWFILKSWILFAILILIFQTFDWLWQPAWNHILVAKTKGKAIATTRSVVFLVFALYTTVGKQLLATLPLQYAFIILGIVILVVNAIFAKKIIAMDKK